MKRIDGLDDGGDRVLTDCSSRQRGVKNVKFEPLSDDILQDIIDLQNELGPLPEEEDYA